MLPKNRRIERKYFDLILSQNQRNHSPHFLLYISPIQEKSKTSSKFAFSASKKVAKSAVLRNKCRRQGYSIISKYINRIKPGFFLFFSFKKLPSDKFKNLELEVLNLLGATSMLV